MRTDPESMMREAYDEEVARAERERIRQILASAAAKDAPVFAHHLALHTDTPAERAIDLLTAAD